MTIYTKDEFDKYVAEVMFGTINNYGSAVFICSECGMEDLFQTSVENMSFTCTNCLTRYEIEP